MEKITSFHPGGRDLTLEAARACGWQPGMRVLDVGCGDGATLVLLRDELGLKCVGCDKDEGFLARARARDASLKLRKTDGFGLDFPSLYFDGAILECSFSLMDRHDELLHELFCVLKPGACFAVTDLYDRNPDLEKAAETYYEAKLALNATRQENDCENADALLSPYLVDGRFIIDNLLHAVMETGFEIALFRDRTKLLQDFYAQLLFDYGSPDAFWRETLPTGTKPQCRARMDKNTGYFLLVCRKPGATA